MAKEITRIDKGKTANTGNSGIDWLGELWVANDLSGIP